MPPATSESHDALAAIDAPANAIGLLRAASVALLRDELADALPQFLEEAQKLLGAAAASVLLVDKASKELFFAAASGEKADQIVNSRLGESQGIAGQVLASGETSVDNDVAKSEKHHVKFDQEMGFTTRQIVAAPLRHGDFVFGVLELINAEAGEFDERSKMLAEILANMVAAAIWQSRAYTRAFSALALDRAEFEAGSPLIGKSASLDKLRQLVPKIAKSDAPILVRGESGVGKEVLARIIWKASKRSRRTFLATNCAAIPPTLIESELFGHEKGAFTGAHQLRKGRFEAADKGTLFLDEIGELPIEMQAKLLRVLQEMEFTRVGGTKPIKVDVRVIAATNRDLEEAVKAKTFREDLYYRLNVIPCTIPPLRDRGGDIRLLLEFFIAHFNETMGRAVEGVDDECMAALEAYSWPGNVRELRNVVERLMVLNDGPVLDSLLLPAEIKAAVANSE